MYLLGLIHVGNTHTLGQYNPLLVFTSISVYMLILLYRITGYFYGPEIFAFCSKTLNLIFCEFNFMRLIGAAK